MKRLLAIAAILVVFGIPARADDAKPAAAMTSILSQSDNSRTTAWAEHEAAVARAFHRKQGSVAQPTTLNDVAPAAGGSTASPVPVYTPKTTTAPLQYPQANDYSNVPMRSRNLTEDPRNMPLMIGNIPR